MGSAQERFRPVKLPVLGFFRTSLGASSGELPERCRAGGCWHVGCCLPQERPACYRAWELGRVTGSWLFQAVCVHFWATHESA